MIYLYRRNVYILYSEVLRIFKILLLKLFGSFIHSKRLDLLKGVGNFFPVLQVFVSYVYYVYPELRISYAGFELGKGAVRENKRVTKGVRGNMKGAGGCIIEGVCSGSWSRKRRRYNRVTASLLAPD